MGARPCRLNSPSGMDNNEISMTYARAATKIDYLEYFENLVFTVIVKKKDNLLFFFQKKTE